MEDDIERSIVRRQLGTDVDNPGPQIAEVVAEVEDREMEELSTMYECVDGVLDDLFSDPPSEDAQMAVAFSYEGYRVTVEQDGLVEFIPIDAQPVR